MEAQLKAFLEELSTTSKQSFTHTTKEGNGWGPGKYYIKNDEDVKNFFTLYCNAISSKHKIRPTITERPEEFTPLRFDFDMEAEIEGGIKRRYTKETLKDLIYIIQEELKNIIPNDAFNPDYLSCIVLEKPAPRVERSHVKDGFHLHFPFFICHRWVQDEYIRKRVIRRLEEDETFRDCKYLTSIEKMVDKLGGKPWMMYGSMNYKNEKSLPYIYNNWEKIAPNRRYGIAFDGELKEISLEEMFEAQMAGRKNSVRYYLPELLSIRGHTDPIPLTREVMRAKKLHEKKLKEKNSKKTRKKTEEEIAQDIKYIIDNNILEMIGDERADSWDDWMQVGWALYAISDGTEDGLRLWIEFSQRSDKFIEGECEELWTKMEGRNRTIGTLMFMAKNDSPEDYNFMKLAQLDTHIQNSLRRSKPNEWDVGMVVVHMYKDRFLCADDKKNEWWEFRNHRWKKNGAISIKKLMSTEVWDEYGRYEQKLASRQMANHGEDEDGDTENSDKAKQYRKRVWKIQDLLKQDAFKRKVLEACKENLFDEEFHKKRDENPMFMGCENGVIDLEALQFREGRPDDFITYSNGIHFNPHITYEDDEILELNDFLLKVFPNSNRRTYFLDFMTTCLMGGNIHKRFLVCTGSGNNAKSVTCHLIKVIFGEYHQTLPRETFIKAGNNGVGPKPHLSSVRGKRVLLLSELTPGDEINYGMIKEMTGNDAFWVRGMYEKGGEITPMFTLILQCNDPPRIPGQDKATWNRIRVLDFESTFVMPNELESIPVPDTLDEQLKMRRFRADPAFKDERLPELYPAFLWLLFNRFKEKRGLYEPPEVMQATNIYKANNDVYQQFIRDKIVKIDNEEIVRDTYVSEVIMFDEFREWYRENYPYVNKKDAIGKMKMVKELKARLDFDKHSEDKKYYYLNKRFYGYQIYQEEVEEMATGTGGLLKR